MKHLFFMLMLLAVPAFADVTSFDSDPIPATCSFTQAGYNYCNLSVPGLLATDNIQSVGMLYPGQYPSAIAGYVDAGRTDGFLGTFFSVYPGDGGKIRVSVVR